MAIARYDSLPVFHREISSTEAAIDYEGKVAGLWHFILHHYFPSIEEYVHRPQDKVESGFLDFHTAHWMRGQECLFLVTQTKREARDVGELAWDEGKAQLARYLAAQARLTRSRQDHLRGALWSSAATRRYGIVAVGKRCRFYEYGGSGLHPIADERDEEDEEDEGEEGDESVKYSLVKNARAVHKKLLQIKRKH
ncbi:hypothetical protein PHISP_08243 [Aspergillus sp. HF37]|nr:hypothetical protein PHISP_08243 [Aspergillus sp. HF37]